MLTATFLALGAAVLHAGWNVWVKQSSDPWISLWGQMTVAALIGALVIAANGGVENVAWTQALLSGLIHTVYVLALARAYTLGDFSVTYPIARGSGALLAALGGVLFLNDQLSLLMILGICISAVGILLLAGRADNKHVFAALLVALTIGLYSNVDSSGSREMGGNMYPFLIFITCSLGLTTFGIATQRGTHMVSAMRTTWKRFSVAGAASLLTYWMVLRAVQTAPVGYVTALRESSVIIVAFVGTHILKESDKKRKITAACIVVVGLAVLVIGR